MSVLTVGEIEKGIVRLPSGRRRTDLERWLSRELPEWIEDRVLGIDWEIARLWGRLVAAGNAIGRPLPLVDGLLAATAMHHGLVLVTRNTSDVEATGVRVFNPWES